jgi:hypothetical protein
VVSWSAESWSLISFSAPCRQRRAKCAVPFRNGPACSSPSAPTWGTRCTALSDLTPHHESVIRLRCLVPIRPWAESFEWPPEIHNSRRVRSPSNGLPGRRGTVQFCVATPQSPSLVPVTVHADVRNILLESGFIAILNRHRATDWVWHRLAHVHVQHHALDCHAVQVTKRALCLPKLTDTPSNPFIPVLGPWYSMTLLHHALAHSDCNTVIRVPLTFQAPPIHLVCFRNDSNQHHDYQRMRALRCTCRGAEQNVLDPIMT